MTTVCLVPFSSVPDIIRPNSALNFHKWPSKCVKIVYHTFCWCRNILFFFRKSKKSVSFRKLWTFKNSRPRLKANKLTHASKTKYILFRKKTKVLVCDSLKLFIKIKEIDRIGAGCKNESFKFVGIHLDENLTWNHHLSSVCIMREI